MVQTTGLTTWVTGALVSEPVTLSSVKEYLQLDICAHDNLLTGLISQARVRLEAFTGLSLALQTRVACWNSVAAGTRLPYAPVVSITEGAALLSESPFPSFLADSPQAVKVSYEAGYGYGEGMIPLPADLKGCILKIVRDEFELGTGISLKPDSTLPADWKTVARRHRQFSVFS